MQVSTNNLFSKEALAELNMLSAILQEVGSVENVNDAHAWLKFGLMFSVKNIYVVLVSFDQSNLIMEEEVLQVLNDLRKSNLAS